MSRCKVPLFTLYPPRSRKRTSRRTTMTTSFPNSELMTKVKPNSKINWWNYGPTSRVENCMDILVGSRFTNKIRSETRFVRSTYKIHQKCCWDVISWLKIRVNSLFLWFLVSGIHWKDTNVSIVCRYTIIFYSSSKVSNVRNFLRSSSVSKPILFRISCSTPINRSTV